MSRILVSSRSFGKVSDLGEGALKASGFEIVRISPDERPITEEKMIRIISAEMPKIVICGAEPLTKNVMLACPNLQMIMKHGVGIDNIDIDAATNRKIIVANAPGTNTESVADLTIALMLALLRGVVNATNSTKTGGWERYIGHELGTRTVGVVGTGRIGLCVIQRLQGFGSDILAYDVIQNESLIGKPKFQYCSLEDLLRKSDIVTLHAPLTASTRNFIGNRELDLMKSSAYLVNLARGELVDEDALYQFLQHNRIAGAAVDVFAVEPPQSSPLLKLENLLATPHIAAYTHEAMDRMDQVCYETIISTLRGEVLPNVLNPEVLTK
jgi:D-3-phosphoglycerate dehydrogenase